MCITMAIKAEDNEFCFLKKSRCSVLANNKSSTETNTIISFRTSIPEFCN